MDKGIEIHLTFTLEETNVFIPNMNIHIREPRTSMDISHHSLHSICIYLSLYLHPFRSQFAQQ